MNVQNRGGISDETNFDLDIYYIKNSFIKTQKCIDNILVSKYFREN